MFQNLLVQIAVKAMLDLLCKVLDFCVPFCPDGVCEKAIADLRVIQRKVESPNLRVASEVGSFSDFVRCLPVKRFVAWIQEGVSIFNEMRICNDEDGQEITLGEVADPEA